MPTHSHCPSYYEASRNDAASYAPLRGDTRAHVCIVGGGFTGLSAALSLAERGYEVIVLEQHAIGWGASGRSGGQMIGGTSGDEGLARAFGTDGERQVHELSYRGHAIIEERIERFGIDCDLRYGYIDVACNQRHVRQQQAQHESLCNLGFAEHIELVAEKDLPALIGTDIYRGGLVNRRNGHLHPLNLCLGEARAAASQGVRIHEGTEVLDIRYGKRAGVITPNGTVSAERVILAGNAYQQLEMNRLSGLVFPAGTFIIATEPLSEEEVAAMNPQNLAVCDQNTVLDYYRLSADRRLLFGGRCNYSGREPDSISGTMLPRLRKVYPGLANKRIDFAWGGKIGIVLNRVPVIGRLNRHTFYALGYSGHGVNMTHVAGEVLAKAVDGDMAMLDVFERVRHRRLPIGQAAGSQLVSLGMLYYRLRDITG